MLRLNDKWVWDFWFAQDGADTHIFYLQADRSLKDERLRHWNVSIGHAVSQDLRQWEVLPDALAPSPVDPNATVEPFDTYTTWTGSIIRHAGEWYMFYTGSRRSEKGLVQRIGLATSSDLIHWTKHGPHSLIEADPTWYELLDLDLWHDQAWRDPWVFKDEETGRFHALITARANHGPADERGVIGHASSDNLIDWQVEPPLTQPGEFGHLEVPQVIPIDGRYYLLFSCPHETTAKSRIDRISQRQDGTGYMMSDAPLGPYHMPTDKFLVTDGKLYSGKVITTPTGDMFYMSFLNYDGEGNFIGVLNDPLPIHVGEGGLLSIDFDNDPLDQ